MAQFKFQRDSIGLAYLLLSPQVARAVSIVASEVAQKVGGTVVNQKTDRARSLVNVKRKNAAAEELKDGGLARAAMATGLDFKGY